MKLIPLFQVFTKYQGYWQLDNLYQFINGSLYTVFNDKDVETELYKNTTNFELRRNLFCQIVAHHPYNTTDSEYIKINFSGLPTVWLNFEPNKSTTIFNVYLPFGFKNILGENTTNDIYLTFTFYEIKN